MSIVTASQRLFPLRQPQIDPYPVAKGPPIPQTNPMKSVDAGPLPIKTTATADNMRLATAASHARTPPSHKRAALRVPPMQIDIQTALDAREAHGGSHLAGRPCLLCANVGWAVTVPAARAQRASGAYQAEEVSGSLRPKLGMADIANMLVTVPRRNCGLHLGLLTATAVSMHRLPNLRPTLAPSRVAAGQHCNCVLRRHTMDNTSISKFQQWPDAYDVSNDLIVHLLIN